MYMYMHHNTLSLRQKSSNCKQGKDKTASQPDEQAGEFELTKLVHGFISTM